LFFQALTEARNVSSSTEPSSPVTIAPSTVAGLPTGSQSSSAPQLNNSDGKLNCQIVGQSRINCSSEVYSDPATWRLSRDFLEQQIRILRVQLDELKVIRKHLRAMRPDKSHAAISKKRTNSKSKSKISSSQSLFDWSSPPKRTAINSSDTSDPGPGGRKHRPKMPQVDADDVEEEEDEGELIDEEEMDHEDEDESTVAGPVESTIEVTIYDNRKIK
jgi:hypothetical protein